MSTITGPQAPVSVEEFEQEVVDELAYAQGVTREQATPADLCLAVSGVVRKHMVDSWLKTQRDMLSSGTKAVGYLSAEFLVGKQLRNALLNTGMVDHFHTVIEHFGMNLQEVVDEEPEPSLGNGGLGRLAACFIDSMTSIGVPAFGYGIQYRYGLFRQEFDEQGRQVERPDYWLTNEDPWGHIDYTRSQRISFGGTVERLADGSAKWNPDWSVRAVPVDYLVPGFTSGRVNTLRLWSARSYDEFDLKAFNEFRYLDAVNPQVEAENISKVLYPEDSSVVGKRLRLQQQYFFVSASIRDAIRVFYAGQENPDLTTFPQKICFQLNDTHPVIGIPELMRVLIDEYGYKWQVAFDVARSTFNYTCHTLLPEALEVWSGELIESLLPRHWQIIQEINDFFIQELKAKGVSSEQIERMRIVTAGERPEVRMAYLASVAGSHVNGVAELHSQLLKDITLKDFSQVYPEKFTNVTNGITPRRFIGLANPRLTALITEGLGTDRWMSELDLLEGLVPLADDEEFVRKFIAVRQANKQDFSTYAKHIYDLDVDPNTMFNTMIKRLHEYKRQSLKILSVIARYVDIKQGRVDADSLVPRTVFFGAKAAPGYYLAKMTIQLINNVSRVISTDPAVKGKLAVCFPNNYNVRLAQHLIPATDLDEQISQAGKEASGTGNMKFALNGALTVGTLDGANVEIRQRVGAENFFLFGMDVNEVEDLYAKGYNPREYYESNDRLRETIDLIAQGAFSHGDTSVYQPLINDWLSRDYFMTLADFASYEDIQNEIDSMYRDEMQWYRRSLLNVARSGYFSSDRSIRDYLERIWKTEPLS